MGEVCEIKRGRIISKQYINNNKGIYPIYSSQTINNGILGKIDTYDFDGEFLTWTTDGANAGSCFYINGKFNITNVCGLIKPINKKILIKYLYYYLKKNLKKNVNYNSPNPKLMSNVVFGIQIPIPSLQTQQKIVEILDKFTELESELESELELRKKQYEFYRNKLLDFSKRERVEYMKIGDITHLTKGKQLNKELLIDNAKYVYINGGSEPSGKYNEFNFEKNNITISQGGASAGYVNFMYENFYAGVHCYVIKTKYDKLNNKYLFYFLKNNQNYFQKSQYGAGIPSLDSKIIKNLLIPIPPIQEQEKIINILDKFDNLINGVKDSLPEEIKLRKQQYEYYRNQLLTFK